MQMLAICVQMWMDDVKVHSMIVMQQVLAVYVQMWTDDIKVHDMIIIMGLLLSIV